MTDHRHAHHISNVTAVMVVALFTASFVLSFFALRDLAYHNGMGDWRCWLWPLMLDAVMVVAGLAILRGTLYAEPTAFPWSLVGTFTALSVVFNAMHVYEQGAMARGVAMLPPIVAFISFELLMLMVRRTIERLAKIESRDAAAAQLATIQAQRDAEIAERDRARIARKREEERLTQARAEVAQARQANDTRARVFAILDERGCELTGEQIGELANTGASNARRYRAEYREISGNGRE